MRIRILLLVIAVSLFIDVARRAGATGEGVAPSVDPDGLRSRCRNLIDKGTRAEAIAACDRTVAVGNTALDMRLCAAALVARPEAPTMAELFRATLLARAAVVLAPGEPWGYAAHLDVARRWGDDQLIARRLEELERVAPQHEETIRARAAITHRTPWARLLGWVALLLIGLATLVRALRGRHQRRARPSVELGASSRLAMVWFLVCLGSIPARSAQAAGAARQPFAIDDADPQASVPDASQQNARPLEFAYFLQVLAERAAAAAKGNDHDAAARYYLALAKAVPDRSLAFSKLCQEYEAGGQRAQAVEACRYALAREGVTVDDYARFVRLVLDKTGDLAASEIAELKAVAEHVVAAPGARAVGCHLQCTLALRIHDVALLETCTAGLVAVAPRDPKTLSFRWSLALEKGQTDEARRLVEEARTAGMTPDAVQRMATATSALGGRRPRFLQRGIALPAGLAALAAGLVVVFARIRRRPERRSA